VSDSGGAGVNTSSLKYQWTTSTTAPTEGSFGTTFTNEEMITKSAGDGGFYLWILAKDNVGNTVITGSNVFKVDNTTPTCSVSYTTTAPTNEAVTVTLTGCSEEVDPRPQSVEMSTNGSGSFAFADVAGNTGSVEYEVTNIDTTEIVAAINYDPITPTSGDVVATINFNKTGVTVTNNGGSTGYTFTGNGSFEFEYEDNAGNTGSKLAEVTNIDKTAPEIVSVTYNPNQTSRTSGDVVVTVTLNETGGTVAGWILNGKVYTKTYTGNKTENVIFYDAVGNSVSTGIAVTKIDKTEPTC
jgi:hypothetical protein